MRIILAGIIGRYPWGGVTWCSLMYLLGLRDLGHDVWYFEDTCECNFDPEQNAIATDPRYALRHIHESLAPFGFAERWCYADYTGRHHGLSEEKARQVCKSADLFVVLSGGCWTWREHYQQIPKKVFVDSDPGFTQLALDAAMKAAQHDPAQRWYVDFLRVYDRHFTFGSNVGTVHSDVPDCGIEWLPTWQPVAPDIWTPAADRVPPREVYTTVMTWRTESFTAIGGNKDEEFLKVRDIARRLRAEGGPDIELAISGPRELLTDWGWRTVDAFAVSADLWRYHAYLSSSRGEFSVAKRTYVERRTGWFSDRTACYLMAGKPAVVQETGFSRTLPTGAGLFAWKTAEEAIAALREVEKDYAHHSRNARELAMEHFRPDKVLKEMLDRV